MAAWMEPVSSRSPSPAAPKSRTLSSTDSGRVSTTASQGAEPSSGSKRTLWRAPGVRPST